MAIALPNNSVPYYWLPAFLVRKGNPKNIKDWSDLVRDDVKVVFPNPKTSGNGRYTYLAAYAYALEANKGDQEKAKEFVRKLFANVPVFDTGGRAAITTFVEHGIGDVLVTFEAEVQSIGSQYGKDKTDLVIPPVSLRADFPVAVVDKVVDERGRASSPRPICNISTRPRRRRSLLLTSTAQSTRRLRQSTRTISPMCVCSRSKTSLAVGKRCRKSISPMAVFSTSST